MERVLLASITGDSWLLEVCIDSIVVIQKFHTTELEENTGNSNSRNENLEGEVRILAERG